jgi:exosortase A-associated hydrolase 1
MRRLLSFSCEGALLGGTVDEASGPIGVLIVTGGSQTRIGSHRMFERLAAALAAHDYPCFRFDRRGVGDSEGEDPGFKGSGLDLAAAAEAFRSVCPGVRRIAGFGLCDGATALALFGADAGVERLVLANPWFVEAEAGEPPAAAIKQHYRQQLTSLEGWKKIFSGSISYGKLLRGIKKVASPPPADLAGEVAAKLKAKPLPLGLLLCRGDATAVAADDVWRSAPYRPLRQRSPAPIYIESDSHTFARAGDADALLEAVLAALRQT